MTITYSSFLTAMLLWLLALQDRLTITKAAKVVTLGDSFSSGVGVSRNIWDYEDLTTTSETLDGVTYTFTDDHFCARYPTTLAGHKLATEQGIDSVMIACGGASIQHLRDQIAYLNDRYPEERSIQWSGSTILLTIGLNDLRSVHGEPWFSTLLGFKLHVFGDCSTDPDHQLANLEEVTTNLEATLQLLVSEASEAVIRIFGYGKLFQRHDRGTCHSLGISNGEADLLDNVYFGAINEASANVVANIQAENPNVDMEFIDVDSYLTIGSCSSNDDDDDPHLNGVLACFPLPYSLASYHPSQKGYNSYYDALVDNLAAA